MRRGLSSELPYIPCFYTSGKENNKVGQFIHSSGGGKCGTNFGGSNNSIKVEEDVVVVKGDGPRLPGLKPTLLSFWDTLHAGGGHWMWNYVSDK